MRRLEGRVVPVRTTIVPGSAGLVYLPAPLLGPPTYSAILIRHPSLVLALDLLFDSLWQDPRTGGLDAYGHPRG